MGRTPRLHWQVGHDDPRWQDLRQLKALGGDKGRVFLSKSSSSIPSSMLRVAGGGADAVMLHVASQRRSRPTLLTRDACECVASSCLCACASHRIPRIGSQRPSAGREGRDLTREDARSTAVISLVICLPRHVAAYAL